MPGQGCDYAGAGQVVQAASGLATLPGTNPTGYEIFNAMFAWGQCKEERSCKCGLPRFCSTDLKNRDLRRRNETQNNQIAFFSDLGKLGGKLFPQFERECFLQLRWMCFN